jgi:hypothetical protein
MRAVEHVGVGRQLQDRVVAGGVRRVTVRARGAAVAHLDHVGDDLDGGTVLPPQRVVSGLDERLDGDGLVHVVVGGRLGARLLLVERADLRLRRIPLGRAGRGLRRRGRSRGEHASEQNREGDHAFAQPSRTVRERL